MDNLKFKAMLASRQFKQLLSDGVSLRDLLAAGASWGDLRAAGARWRELLAAGASLHDLLAAEVSWGDLRAAGFSLRVLHAAGARWGDLLAAGASLHDLLADGASWGELHAAEVSWGDLRAAGASWDDLLAAGARLRDLRAAGAVPLKLGGLESSVPIVENPYTRILADIQAGQRLHDQSTFGPECDPATNLCGSAMCTGGHLVNLGGAAGYALKDKYGWATAAALIHEKAHPGWPCQDFGMIPQENALAYIEYMAACESSGIVPFAEVEK